MRSPVGAQTGPLAPPLTFEILRALAPLSSAIHSCPLAMYAIRFPSGDQRASLARVFASGHCCTSARNDSPSDPELPGPTLMSLVTVVRLFALTSVVRTEYNTRRPSGETRGSPTFLTAAKSSNVMGR